MVCLFSSNAFTTFSEERAISHAEQDINRLVAEGKLEEAVGPVASTNEFELATRPLAEYASNYSQMERAYRAAFYSKDETIYKQVIMSLDGKSLPDSQRVEATLYR